MTRVALFILGPKAKIGKNIEILEKKKRKKKKKKRCEFFWGVGWGVYILLIWSILLKEKRERERYCSF